MIFFDSKGAHTSGFFIVGKEIIRLAFLRFKNICFAETMIFSGHK